MKIRKTKTGYRSKFEENQSKLLKEYGYKYEPFKMEYIIPQSKHNYTPDFVKGNIILELKGRWTREDRKKILYIRSQHPKFYLVMVFQNENLPIYKGSKITYAKYCDKLGIRYVNYKNLQEFLNAHKSIC